MSNTFSAVVTLGRDAEQRFLASGQAMLTFTAASNTGFGDKKKTTWIRVSLFGKRAEGQLQNYLKKGVQCYVSGEISLNEYQANDGTTKTSLELVANVVDLVGGKRDDSQASQSRPAVQAKNDAPPYDDYDDSLPF